MNAQAILGIVMLVAQYAPQALQIFQEGISNDDIATKIKAMSKPFADLLTEVGGALFPKAAPQIAMVGAVMASFDPNTTRWLQTALNRLVKDLPAPLVVDGVYGPKTRDAVSMLQKQFGLTIDGVAGQITQAAVQMALSHLPDLTPAPAPAPTPAPEPAPAPAA